MVVRTGIVGAGTISETHLEGTKQNPRAELVGICDVDRSAAERMATEYGIPWFTSVDALIEEGIDCLHICTPVQTHHHIAEKAMKAGVAVVIEKPVAMTVEEVEDLIEISEQYDVLATAVHSHLSRILSRQITGMIDNGVLGDIQGVDIIHSGNTSPNEVKRGSWVFDLPGGEFEEGLPHPIYKGIGFAGYPRSVDDINAQTVLNGTYERDFSYDDVQVQFVSESSTLCSIKILSNNQKQRLTIIHGTEKSVLVDSVTKSVQILEESYAGSPVFRAKKSIDTIKVQLDALAGGAKQLMKSRMQNEWESQVELTPHYTIFDEFAKAIESGGEPPHPLEQAKWTIQVLETIHRDAEGKEQSTIPT
jgi:predicted dehydrogenase